MNTILHASPRARSPINARAGGFTLIEMMISITIGLGILAGLVGVLATNASNSRTNDRTSELMSNGRYALDSIKTELRQAGFRGYTWAEPSAPNATVTASALVNECAVPSAAAGAFLSNIRQGVWGANDTNPFAQSCIPAANYAAPNDVLVIRRVSAVPVPDAALADDALYFRSTYDVGQVFRGKTLPVFPGSPAPLASFALQSYAYFISPFTVSAAELPLVPALYRVALQPDGSMVRELVASGIERMQVQYGVSSAAGTQYVDTLAGTSVDTAPNTTWDSVNSVRIWLLARNATPEPGYNNTSSYPMGSQTYTVADNFRRQLFSTVVQLRN